MKQDHLHENWTGKMGESPEGRQMKPNGFPTFSKTSWGSPLTLAAPSAREGIGRIRLRRIPNASSPRLLSFVKDALEPGSTVITDGWEGYEGLKEAGYKHKVRVISGGGKTASALLPRVHRVASLLKRWLLGTHQGGVSRGHLAYYLDEFTFRFNRRTSRHRGKLFYRLVEQAVTVGPMPYSRLISGPNHNG